MTELRKAAEALRLAEILSNGNAMDCLEHSVDAANELFRLHEENKALRQALAQPEQELFTAKQVAEAVEAAIKFSKREWVGLTDEEIAEYAWMGKDVVSVIKEVQETLKEKNT